MKKTAFYKWGGGRFSEGRESFTGEERSGRPATSRTEENMANAKIMSTHAVTTSKCQVSTLTYTNVLSPVNIQSAEKNSKAVLLK